MINPVNKLLGLKSRIANLSFMQVFPGVAIAVALAFIAYILSLFIPNLSAVLLALLFGIVVGNTVMIKDHHQAGIYFSEKFILETAIVMIGFGFQLEVLLRLGWPVFLWMIISVLAVMTFAVLAGKLFGTPSKFNFLLGAGSSICGSAAIAATAPLLRANSEETGLALTLINFLGLMGILVLPLLSLTIGYSDLESGVLTGGVLQSMGHVVAAAFSMGELTGETATVVKMGRIVLLVPFLLLLFFRQQRNAGASDAKLQFPVFVGLFIGSVAVSQFGFFPDKLAAFFSDLGGYLLIVAMAGIGLKIRIKPLLRISLKGSIVGLLVFLFQIALFVAVLGWGLI